MNSSPLSHTINMNSMNMQESESSATVPYHSKDFAGFCSHNVDFCVFFSDFHLLSPGRKLNITKMKPQTYFMFALKQNKIIHPH